MGLCAAILDIPFCSHTGIKTMRKGGASSQGPPTLLATDGSLSAGYAICVLNSATVSVSREGLAAAPFTRVRLVRTQRQQS